MKERVHMVLERGEGCMTADGGEKGKKKGETTIFREKGGIILEGAALNVKRRP